VYDYVKVGTVDEVVDLMKVYADVQEASDQDVIDVATAAVVVAATAGVAAAAAVVVLVALVVFYKILLAVVAAAVPVFSKAQ